LGVLPVPVLELGARDVVDEHVVVRRLLGRQLVRRPALLAPDPVDHAGAVGIVVRQVLDHRLLGLVGVGPQHAVTERREPDVGQLEARLGDEHGAPVHRVGVLVERQVRGLEVAHDPAERHAQLVVALLVALEQLLALAGVGDRLPRQGHHDDEDRDRDHHLDERHPGLPAARAHHWPPCLLPCLLLPAAGSSWAPMPLSTLSIDPASVKNATTFMSRSLPSTFHFTVNVTLRIVTLRICWNIWYWPWMNDAPAAASTSAPLPLPPPPSPPPPNWVSMPPSALFSKQPSSTLSPEGEAEPDVADAALDFDSELDLLDSEPDFSEPEPLQRPAAIAWSLSQVGSSTSSTL